ncbi:MAG TPA: hypothetical protein VJO72_04780, partial [Candidatus Dormibacteraeota bacterium]|nr:hypothetical protein [Candidatus Dormibacteraeota bacterium]
MSPTANGRRERAFLMALDYESQGRAAIEEQLLELGELARTAGATVVGTDVQRRARPDPALGRQGGGRDPGPRPVGDQRLLPG